MRFQSLAHSASRLDVCPDPWLAIYL